MSVSQNEGLILFSDYNYYETVKKQMEYLQIFGLDHKQMYALQIENKNKILNVILLFYLKNELEKGSDEFEKMILKLSQKIYDLDNTYWADIFEKGMREVQTYRSSNRFRDKLYNIQQEDTMKLIFQQFKKDPEFNQSAIKILREELVDFFFQLDTELSRMMLRGTPIEDLINDFQKKDYDRSDKTQLQILLDIGSLLIKSNIFVINEDRLMAEKRQTNYNHNIIIHISQMGVYFISDQDSIKSFSILRDNQLQIKKENNNQQNMENSHYLKRENSYQLIKDNFLSSKKESNNTQQFIENSNKLSKLNSLENSKQPNNIWNDHKSEIHLDQTVEQFYNTMFEFNKEIDENCQNPQKVISYRKTMSYQKVNHKIEENRSRSIQKRVLIQPSIVRVNPPHVINQYQHYNYNIGYRIL